MTGYASRLFLVVMSTETVAASAALDVSEIAYGVVPKLLALAMTVTSATVAIPANKAMLVATSSTATSAAAKLAAVYDRRYSHDFVYSLLYRKTPLYTTEVDHVIGNSAFDVIFDQRGRNRNQKKS